jgi:thioredoxin-related protein
MRRIVIAFLLSLPAYSYQTFSQKTLEKTVGIDFKNTALDEAFQLAKSQNKPLFIEVYLTGCSHCEALAAILQEKEVGDFYNQRFVSWKTEANSEASKQLQALKKLTYPEFPLLFFFDPEGNLLHMGTPPEKSDKNAFIGEINLLGRQALDPQTQTSKYPARFAGGQRDLAFLIRYGKLAKAIKDDEALRLINDAFAQQLVTDQDRKSKPGFYVLQRFIDDYNSTLAKYFFAHLSEFKALYAEKDVRESGESIIFHSLFGARADSYTPEDITSMRHQMVALGVSAEEAAGRTLLVETEAFFRAKDTRGALMVFNGYRRIAKSVGMADYAYMIKLFNEKAPDGSYFSEMAVWADSAMQTSKAEDKKGQTAADLYFHLAETYERAGERLQAQESAAKALEIAQAAKVNLVRFEEQVKRIKP